MHISEECLVTDCRSFNIFIKLYFAIKDHWKYIIRTLSLKKQQLENAVIMIGKTEHRNI